MKKSEKIKYYYDNPCYCLSCGKIIEYDGVQPLHKALEFNRYGLVKTYDGIGVAGISGAKKTGTGSLLLPDKRIYGIAGKIGNLDMKGEVHTYQDMNNQNEKVHIMLKDFTYGFMLTNIENFAKVTLQ